MRNGLNSNAIFFVVLLTICFYSSAYAADYGRRKWTFEEDQELLRQVEIHGNNYRAMVMHGRTRKQMGERWRNHLMPGIIKGKLTADEWEVVVQSRKFYGNRWTEIAKLLPGRTPNQLKNWFHARERKETRGVIPKQQSSNAAENSQPRFFLKPRPTKPFRDPCDLINLVNNWEGPDNYRQLKGLYLAALIEYPEFSAEINARLSLLALSEEMTEGITALADSVLGDEETCFKPCCKENEPPEPLNLENRLE